MHIILASASPRRRELIHQIRWEGDIEPGHFPEVTDEKEALAFIRKRGLETEFAPSPRGTWCAPSTPSARPKMPLPDGAI